MADQGSGGSRLPLALPSASQGCSSGGGGSSAGNSGHPPPPRNLQGLLQMAITAGSEEPDPPPEPMSEERRQWLQEAMSAAFRGQREEVEQMKNCLRVLTQPTPSLAAEAELASDQQEREGALELLADLCENMDNAAGTARPACGCPWSPSVSSLLLSPTSCWGLALVLSLRDHTTPLTFSPPFQPPASPSLGCLQLRP